MEAIVVCGCHEPHSSPTKGLLTFYAFVGQWRQCPNKYCFFLFFANFIFIFLMIKIIFSFFSCSFLASMHKSWLDGKSGGNAEIWHFYHLTILWVFKGIEIEDIVYSKLLMQKCYNRFSPTEHDFWFCWRLIKSQIAVWANHC